jgi:hypothetical protein
MELRRVVMGAAGAAMVVTALAIAAAAPASAACRATREAYARGPFQTIAEISARNKWRSAVRQRYGVRYTRWSLAQEKTMRCRKLLPGRRWHCVARARPCSS